MLLFVVCYINHQYQSIDQVIYIKGNIYHAIKQSLHTFLQNKIKYAIKYPSPQFIRTQIQTKPNNTGFREQG